MIVTATLPPPPTSPTIDQALQQAVAKHKAGQLQEAERLYRAILQAQPKHPDANHNLGVLAVQVKQPAAGLPHFRAALEAAPHQGQYWLSYVDALMQAGQADAARQVLEQGRQRGLQGDAVEALAKRLESGAAAAARGGHEQGKPGKRGPASARKGAGAQEVDALAALFAQGRYGEAETQARALTARIPTHGIGWKALGTALKLQGRSAEALPPLQKAAGLLPGDAETHYNLGITLKELGRAGEAEASYQRAIRVRPDYAEAHYDLGIVLQERDCVVEAEASYHRAIQAKPGYYEAHNNLGAALWNMSRLGEAEASCRRSLQLRPDYAEALNNLGNILSSLGRLEEAAACYRKALEYKPGWALLYFNLHPLQLNAADMAPAIGSLTKAVELEPANDNYRFFLGMMLDYSGNPEAAAEHFERLERSADLQRARLDAWRYIKSANGRLPITGSNIQAFRMGLGMAANEGLVLEFGVRFGASIRQIAALANQEVHGFDSFEGLPEQWHHEPKGMYSTKGVIPEVPDNVTLYAGWFEDTLPAFLQNHAGPVRFMNIDCDIYSSTKTVLDLLADRIIPGTVIVFDEYIGNAHWREDEFKAFQEAVARYGWDYEYVCFSFFTKQVAVRIVAIADAESRRGAQSNTDAPAGKPVRQEGTEPGAQEMNRLVALFAGGQYTEAATLAQAMTERFPLHGFGWKVLGAAHQQAGRGADALAALQKAAELSPDDAETHSVLGVTLKNLGRPDEAEASFRRALRLDPDLAEAHNNLGNILKDTGRLNEAEASYRQALRIEPDYAEANYNLGNILHDSGSLDEAEASYRQALRIEPDYAEAHCNLGNTLKDTGRLGEAEASYRRALQLKPDLAEAHDNLLFLCGYHDLLDPREYLLLARGWELACVPVQDRQAARHRVFRRPPPGGRRLKVGYVSGDYRQHAVSYFIEQLFAHHDRTRIELFAYSTHFKRDAVTERLQALAEHWTPVAGMTDAAIRDRIEADGIDVLIDLSGHTMHNRLGVFARRAAPVQAHYLGYFASTGLTEMDYWIGDDILTPAETDSHFSERVWRLPRVWVCYDGKADAPLPGWQPGRDGSVWLGSFNNLAKLAPAALALWAKVLHALPEGKLLLKTKALSDTGNRRRILDALTGHGVSPERIELQGMSRDWPSHMACYDRLDIALDPVGGVGGGTTTCDALWMGAPVVTLEGDRMASRMTASMLNAIGRPEWVARSEAEYIDKVVALARDVEQRKALRSGQRDRMAGSPLCNAKDLSLSLENACLEMFERWFYKKN